MATYMQTGNTIQISADGAFTIHDKLPAGVYNIMVAPMQPPCLQFREPLSMPKKVYGDLDTISNHILASFDQRTSNTGVLLSGMKGSGKTLIARNVSNRLLEQGVPTIVVQPSQINPGIISFLQLISAPCMLLFDEIDKIPGDNDDVRCATDCMLGFLDGLCLGKKLSVLTVNERDRVNCNFLDRPGRILYHYKFSGITVETAKQFCQDKLEVKEQWPALERIVMFSRNLSFDMLQAIVEECNRFKCSPNEALKILNVNPTISGRFEFSVTSTKNRRVLWNPYQTCELHFEVDPFWIRPEFAVETPKSEITDEMRAIYSTYEVYHVNGRDYPAAKDCEWVEYHDHFNCSDYVSMKDGVVTYDYYEGIILEFRPYTPTYNTMEWD